MVITIQVRESYPLGTVITYTFYVIYATAIFY